MSLWPLYEVHLLAILCQNRLLRHQILAQSKITTKGFYSDSIADLRQSAQDNNELLQRIAGRARSLWQDSQHDGREARHFPEAVVGSGDSVFELSSIIPDTQFDFDNEILGSGSYRQAIIPPPKYRMDQPY